MERKMLSGFSDEHIARMLKEHRGASEVADLAACLGITEDTVRRWQAEVNEEEATLEVRLRQLEGENVILKRLLAEAELDKAALKEVLRGNW